MLSLLKKPYPFIGDIKRDVTSNAIIGLFVALFLIAFQPFQISEWITPNKILKLSGFGLISFLMPTCLNLLLNIINKQGVLEQKWNVLAEIISVIGVLVLITIGNVLYGHMLYVIPLNLKAFILIFMATCIVAVFPVTVHVMLKHNRLLKLNLENSLQLNAQLKALHEQIVLPKEGNNSRLKNKSESQSTDVSLPLLTEEVLLAENEKDTIRFMPHSLRIIESADNYSTLITFENGQRKKQIIRSSLKRIESQLKDEYIVRCHRTYIVNLRQVKSAEGNAAGYKLSFYDVEDTVPVSRNFIEKVNSKLKNL